MNADASFDLPRIHDETFVRALDFHWDLDSTNSRALQHAEQAELNTPLLVLAERQTQGRGRGANRWWSAPGALTFSLLIPLDEIPAERLPMIALTVGLAICQAVEQVAPQADLALKWPNDVYLDERKLAGILIELPGRRPPHAVLGVGINVNNSMQETENELAQTSVSLRDAPRLEVDRTDLLIRCLQGMERRLDELRADSTGLIDQWRAYHLLHDRAVEIDTYHEILRGTCRGIDHDGALLVETPEGLHRCLGGVITSFERR